MNVNEDDFDWSRYDAEMADTEAGQAPQIIDAGVLATRLLWDVAPHSMLPEVAEFLGFPPTSEEVMETEHEDCHMRLEAARPVIPFLPAMVHGAAAAATGAIIVAEGIGEGIDPEERDRAIAKLEPIIYQSAWGIIAELIDLGLLHTPHGFMFVTAEATSE